MAYEYKCKECGKSYFTAAEPYAIKDDPCTCGGKTLPVEKKEMKLKIEEN